MMVGPVRPQSPQNWVQVVSVQPMAFKTMHGMVAGTWVEGLPAPIVG